MRALGISDLATLKQLLNAESRISDDARYLHRLHCLASVGAGQSCETVAKCYGGSARSVERWVHRWEKLGALGLRDHHVRGRAGLCGSFLPNLRSIIAGSPDALGYAATAWTGQLLRGHLCATHGINFSLRHCQRLLRDLRVAESSVARECHDADATHRMSSRAASVCSPAPVGPP